VILSDDTGGIVAVGAVSGLVGGEVEVKAAPEDALFHRTGSGGPAVVPDRGEPDQSDPEQ